MRTIDAHDHAITCMQLPRFRGAVREEGETQVLRLRRSPDRRVLRLQLSIPRVCGGRAGGNGLEEAGGK